jgi:hypothetical protein
MLLQYANDLDTAVKIWDMNSGLCVWSVNDKSVLAVYKLFIAAASSTIFVGHSLGKVSVYQLHGQSAIALGCRPTAKADDAQTISAATSLSQTSESTSLLVDLGSAISDEGIFECHSSSGNIVRNTPRLRLKPVFHDLFAEMSSSVFKRPKILYISI